MRQKVILLGGVYGSGKSTTAGLIAEHPQNEWKTKVVDYDLLIGNSRGREIDMQNINEIRRQVWGNDFFVAIQQQIEAGTELIFAPGTFGTHERRAKYLHGLEEVTSGMVDIIPLYYMLPMKQTISEIKANRIDDTHLVNYIRVHGKYREFNQSFRNDDHSDLLLPSDRGMLSAEYRALLSKHEANQHLLTTPHEDGQHTHRRWVVITRRFDPNHFFELVRKDLRHPLEIRAHFENSYVLPSVEGNGFQPHGIQNTQGLPNTNGVKTEIVRQNLRGFYK